MTAVFEVVVVVMVSMLLLPLMLNVCVDLICHSVLCAIFRYALICIVIEYEQ